MNNKYNVFVGAELKTTITGSFSEVLKEAMRLYGVGVTIKPTDNCLNSQWCKCDKC